MRTLAEHVRRPLEEAQSMDVQLRVAPQLRQAWVLVMRGEALALAALAPPLRVVASELKYLLNVTIAHILYSQKDDGREALQI